MDEATIIKALSSAPSGVALAAVLVLVLYRVLSRVAERHIAALDRVSIAVSEHTKVDLEHHAEVKEAIVRVGARVDTAFDLRDRSDSFELLEREREHTPQSIPRPTTASEQSERRRRKHRTPPG